MALSACSLSFAVRGNSAILPIWTRPPAGGAPAAPDPAMVPRNDRDWVNSGVTLLLQGSFLHEPPLPPAAARPVGPSRPPPRDGPARVDRSQRAHERRLLPRGLRPRERRDLQAARRGLGLHQDRARHGLRGGGARELPSRAARGRSPAVHHAAARS